VSVITTMVAVPNRIEVVVEHLRSAKRESDATLRRLLSPQTLTEGDTVPSGVINEARRLGLIELVGDSIWQLSQAAKSAQDIRELLASVLLTPEKAKAADQERVAQAIAWFLTRGIQNPLRIGENWRTLVEQDCPTSDNAFDLTNPDRCRQFAFWVTYLGFGWRLGVDMPKLSVGEVLVADPSRAIEPILRTTCRPGDIIPIEDVVGRLSDACPVIEGGSVRQYVEGKLTAARHRAEGQLSQSTSFALSRLEYRSAIEMPHPSSDARVLTLSLWPETRPVSHLRLCEDDS